MEPPSILAPQEQTSSDARPRALAGQKRQRSPSPQRDPQTRYTFPAERPHGLQPVEPPQSEDYRHCSNCGHPCWRCISFNAPVDLPRLHESQGSEQESMEPPSTPTSGYSTPSTKKRNTCEADGKKYVGPKDADFEKCILIPCGLYLDRREISDLKPATIFGTQSVAPPSKVFIRKTDEELVDIIGDLKEHKNRQYDEHALTMICTDSIVLRDRNKYNDPFDETQVTRPERRDKWRPHKEGPVAGGIYVYDWDLEPDATYTIAVRMFKADDRFELKSKACEPWLADDNSVCPYLTIEYKVTEKTGKKSHATYQNAAAAMLWLHQRKQIRDALSESLDDLRHYSISIVDAEYVISETRFIGVRYHHRTLVEGFLTKIEDLKLYIEWSNAIHTWGLVSNARSFKDDIEKLLDLKRVPQSFPTPTATHPATNVTVPTPPASRENVQTNHNDA